MNNYRYYFLFSFLVFLLNLSNAFGGINIPFASGVNTSQFTFLSKIMGMADALVFVYARYIGGAFSFLLGIVFLRRIGFSLICFTTGVLLVFFNEINSGLWNQSALKGIFTQ